MDQSLILPSGGYFPPARVLVFDDEPIHARRYYDDIKSEGFVVKCTTDLLEAIELGLEFKPDVSVFDIRVTKVYDDRPMDGIIAFNVLKQSLPFVEPIFISAFIDNQNYFLRASKYNPILISKQDYQKQKLIESVKQKAEESGRNRIDMLARYTQAASEYGLDPRKTIEVLSNLGAVSDNPNLILTQLAENFLIHSEKSKDVDPEIRQIVSVIFDSICKSQNILSIVIDVFAKELPELGILLSAEEACVSKAASSYEKRAVHITSIMKEINQDG
ncbi:MAG: hypothetical protein AB9866_20850 [Syntrophobacteraceae bacterium]